MIENDLSLTGCFHQVLLLPHFLRKREVDGERRRDKDDGKLRSTNLPPSPYIKRGIKNLVVALTIKERG